MHFVRLHRRINQILELFNRIGLWHSEKEATTKERMLKMFYSIYILCFPLSILGGAITSENSVEIVFLVETGIITTVMAIHFVSIIWNKDEIIEQLHQMCVYAVEDQSKYSQITKTLNRIMEFATVFWVSTAFIAMAATLAVPFTGNERKLFFNIAFPLDWKENEIGFWMAFLFLFTESILAAASILFSVIKWYLMANSAMKYEVLANQLRNMGVIKESDELIVQPKISQMEKNKAFLSDLIAGIESYGEINQRTKSMARLLSFSFAAQLTTSALCICGSIYSLAFNISDNLIESIIYGGILLYNIFDIYLIMYLGNEITITSDRLSYGLFESGWVDQPQPTLKLLIIFGEQLKQPQQLMILKLYPITLETFTRILNSAYSMFNILQNFK